MEGRGGLSLQFCEEIPSHPEEWEGNLHLRPLARFTAIILSTGFSLTGDKKNNKNTSWGFNFP